MGLGSWIRDPGSGKKPIPDPGSGSRVKKAPDPGSGSAKLATNYILLTRQENEDGDIVLYSNFIQSRKSQFIFCRYGSDQI
jgi:hypothetical protein